MLPTLVIDQFKLPTEYTLSTKHKLVALKAKILILGIDLMIGTRLHDTTPLHQPGVYAIAS